MMQMVRPAAIADNGGSFLRASVAWYFDSAGVLQQAAINAPRYNYDPVTLKPLGVAIEDASTNYIRNNSGTGATPGTIGSGGAAPTNVFAGTNASGLSVAVAVGTENGIPYTDFRFFGTSTATTEAYLGLENNNPPGVAAAPVDLWCLSANARIVAGDLSNILYAKLRLQPVNGAGGVTGTSLQGADIKADLLAATSIARHRPYFAATIPASYAGTAGVWPLLAFGHTAGAIDFTVRIGGQAMEKNVAAPSSIILTTNAAVTRAADQNTLQLLSNIVEPKTGTDFDPAVWSAATAYATGAQVSRLTTHKIYQRVNAATPVTDAATPESDATKWIEVSSTNKWRMFDQANESQSSIDSLLVAVLRPGTLHDTVGLLNVEGTEARCIVPGTPYDQTINLVTRVVSNWLEYFTETFDTKPEAVFTGLPLRTANQVNIIVSNPGGVARVGNCIIGRSKDIGGVQFGATAGIIDYSQKKTNDFGYTTVVKRAFSKRMNVALLVNADKVDDLQRLLAEYRATPVLWVGAGSLYGALIVYGFYRSFEIVIAYPRQSLCNMQIEGIA